MAIYEETARSWHHLHYLLFSDTLNNVIGRHRSEYAYRGLADASYALSTTLRRLGIYGSVEANLLKQFKKYSVAHVPESDNQWYSLSMAQHYGLPTRLLDWTYSPLVALHFATSDFKEFDKDGAVWRVHFGDVHDLLDARHKGFLRDYGAGVFTFDGLQQSFKDTSDLDKCQRRIKGSPYSDAYNDDIAIFFEPPTIDGRISNQFAYFSVLSDNALDFNDWLGQPRPSGNVRHTKIIIPAKLKWEIRDKLDQSNINERVLFPGLEGLASWLRRHYQNRNLL